MTPKSVLKSIATALALVVGVSAQADVTTVSHVDLKKYIGTWYEVAAIPQSFQKQCVGNTRAEYSLSDDGLIKVLNSCDTAQGKRSVSEGRAKVQDTSSNAKLKVTFVKFIDWIFAFGGDYWILDVAPDYSYALVGDPSAKYAWILSRTPSLPLATYVRAEAKFRAEGYDTCEILTSVQRGGLSSRRPLCKVVAGALDVVDSLAKSGQFTTLLTAIQVTGLEADLRQMHAITLFAPTDSAFSKLNQADLEKRLANKDQLKQLLLKHVAGGLITLSTLKRIPEIKSATGEILKLQTVNHQLFINGAAIEPTSLDSSNAIIHVIDGVIE